MYQRNSELEKLQQEKASIEKKLEQLQHNQQRLENRKSYSDRKKRTHRLCTIAGTIESIAPDIKLLTLPEVNELMETILCLPNVQQAIRSAIQNHEKEEPPIGPVSSERHTN